MFNKNNGNAFLKTMLTVALTSLGIGVLLFVLAPGFLTRNTPPPQSPQLQRQDVIPQPQQISVEAPVPSSVATSVAKSATAGVAGISVLRVESGAIFDKNTSEKWGVGSGVIVTQNGYIITNHHVAGGKSKRIVVSLADGRNVDGVTVWSDPVLDLAVVKVNMTGLTAIPMGDSSRIQVGETAIAIGNPLGLQFQRTVTSGIISALNRTIKIDTETGPNFMEDLIQTDASINPGNSGGPLLNSKGEVIGINTVKVASAEGIGFAIPINVVVPIIRQLTEKGDFVETYMGVFAYDREVMPYIDGNIKLERGIYVATVDDKGPAYGAGIREGCIITQVDGIDMTTMIQLRTYLYSKSPGDTVNVTHLMKGSNKFETIPIKLIAKERDGLITR